MSNMTRRGFLRFGANAALGAGGAGLLTGCPVPVPPFSPTSEPARVVAVRGTDLAEMAREALAAFGGAEAIVHPGETVFIKPNFITVGFLEHNGIEAGECTKPEIVIAVAEECLKAGAAEVIIGEGGQTYSWSWEDIATLDGTTNMAAEAQRLRDAYGGRVTLACLQANSPAWDMIPSPWTRLGGIHVSSLVTRADRVISIPVVKSNRWTHITASLKNFVGVASLQRYGLGTPLRFILHSAGIEQCFLDIVNAVKPDFTIIDCSICCEGNGPFVLPGWWGTTVDMRDRLGDWLLLAGTDPVAADATAARVISHDVDSIPYLRMAYEQGLGQTREDLIQLDGATLDELEVEWEPADYVEGFTEVIIPGLIVLREAHG